MNHPLIRRTALIVLLAVAVPAALCVPAAEAKRETHQFTLFERQGRDPYTLMFPFTVTRPGQIRVYVKVHTSDDKPSVMVVLQKVFAGDRRHPRALVHETHNPERQGLQLRYAVDSVELEEGNLYRVSVSNLSTRRRATGELLINYPQEGEPETEARPVLPDLAIQELALDADCRLQVHLANQGEGRLAATYWERDVPEVKITIGGRPWGGASLKALDPGRKLGPPGGSAVYTSQASLKGPVEVVAELHYPGRVPDENPANNRLARRLTCAQPAADARLPDLAVTSVRTIAGCQVVVRLANRGPGLLPDSAWQPGKSPSVMLYRDGRSWGGADLRVVDPERKLRLPGGRAIYVPNLRLQRPETIRAVVDPGNLVPEQTKTNNSLEQPLTCP